MSVESLNRRIISVNARVKQLNSERQVNIGRQTALRQQLDSALKKYNEDFGVSLSLDTLDAEFERVSVVKAQEVQRMESVLSLIQQGRYKEAEEILGVSEETATNEVPVGETSLSGETTEDEPMSGSQMPMGEASLSEAQTPEVLASPSLDEKPQDNLMKSFSDILTGAVTPPKPTEGSLPAGIPYDDEDDTPPAPPAPPKPKKPAGGAFTSFGQINSGSSYRPQNV